MLILFAIFKIFIEIVVIDKKEDFLRFYEDW